MSKCLVLSLLLVLAFTSLVGHEGHKEMDKQETIQESVPPARECKANCVNSASMPYFSSLFSNKIANWDRACFHPCNCIVHFSLNPLTAR